MRLLLALSVFFLLEGQAWAAKWIEITRDSDGSIFYMDLSSVYKGSYDQIFYWTKTVYKNEHNIPGVTRSVDGKRVWYGMALYADNCETGLIFGPYHQINYGLQNQLLNSVDNNYPGGATPAPETVGEALHKSICFFWKLKTDSNQAF